MSRLRKINRKHAGRFNDGAVDSKGRFWAGSMNDFHVGEPQPEGCVFRLDTDLTLHRMIENVSIPNGMGYSPTRSVFVYDYDSETGTITNKRTFFTLTDEDEAVPDGCTVDTDGHLWIAIHEGSCVIRVSPDGREVARISLKAWRITCPCFGGSEFDELFITSAGVGEDEAKPEGSTDNGSVFRIKTSSTGLRPNKFIMSEKQ
ncbi:rRNA-processing protein cgr1 [Rhizina undulata]